MDKLEKQNEETFNGGDSNLQSLKMSRLSTLLMREMRDRSNEIKPEHVLKDYLGKEVFFAPSSLDQRDIHRFNSLMFGIIPLDFNAVELSPVAPFATNSSVTNLSQNLVLSTTRDSEVIADPTTLLALEAAKLRRDNLYTKEKSKSVKLATSARVLRMQPFEKGKGYSQHFGIYGACTAGRDPEFGSFSEEAVFEHLGLWLDLTESINREYGAGTVDGVEVRISDTDLTEDIINHFNIPRDAVNRNSLVSTWDMFDQYGILLPKMIDSVLHVNDELNLESISNSVGLARLQRLEKRFLERLKIKNPKVKFVFCLNRKAGLGYYSGSCFHIIAKNKDGVSVQLSDGGAVDWTAKLLNSNKERCFTSGFGSELVQKLFIKKQI